jgi:hypothetical protein
MSLSKSSKDSDKGLTVPKFDHGSTDSKGEKWRKWLTLLSSAFGQSYPVFAMQLNDVPEPIDSPDGSKLWNLYWHPMSLRMLSADGSYEKLVVEFTRSQYALYHTLSLNFLSHQRQIIEDHSPLELTRTLMQKHNWPQDDEHLTFLPFGLLCLRGMANKYEDSGVTDALHKYDKFTLAKPFKQNNVSAWIADLQHAWNTWRNAIKDPEHMAAVEITQQVIKCDDPDWKSWALQYSLKVGDAAYTVDDFLEAVQRHDKMQTHTKQKTPLALLGNPHGANKANKGTLRLCANPGCKKKTPGPRLSLCNPCYRERQKNSAALARVPDSVRENNDQKRKDKLKQKFAQLKRNASNMNSEALFTELNKIVEETDEGNDTATQQTQKRRKKGKKPKAEANMAETTEVDIVETAEADLAEAVEANMLDTTTTSKRNVVAKNHVKAKAKAIFKHTTALSLAGKSKKRKTIDAKPTTASTAKQALLVMPDPLAGCVVHTFAGGAKLPSEFLRK